MHLQLQHECAGCLHRESSQLRSEYIRRTRKETEFTRQLAQVAFSDQENLVECTIKCGGKKANGECDIVAIGPYAIAADAELELPPG